MRLKLLFLFLFVANFSFAQEQLSEEQVLQKLDSVIASPFAEDMKETTAEVLLWTQKDSGIEVMDLELFVNSLKSSSRELAPFLLRAYFFGKVQHVLENNVGEDQPSAKVAGLENLVHVYREYLKEHPDAANSETDKLAELEAANELEEYIRGIENRDGLSYETAIIPRSIIAEYQWMKEHYPNAQLLGKELIQHEGKTFDVFEMQNGEGEKFKLYFDTSIIL